MSIYPKMGCHAVLALLSEGYPPLGGRSPTRYSPVCHATNPLLGLRVRLACVRHAASVDSEPGSNSQVKFVDPEPKPEAKLFNPSACYFGSRIHPTKAPSPPKWRGARWAVQVWMVQRSKTLPPADTRRAVLARSI